MSSGSKEAFSHWDLHPPNAMALCASLFEEKGTVVIKFINVLFKIDK
jgi:hypothetical protein